MKFTYEDYAVPYKLDEPKEYWQHRGFMFVPDRSSQACTPSCRA